MPILLAVPLLVLLTAFVALGSAALQHSVSTGFVNWLSRVVGNIPIVGGVLSMKQILKLDGWVLNLVGKHYKQVEHAAIGWLSALDQVVRRHSKAALGLAAPVWSLAYWLVHTEIGRQAKARDTPIAKTADRALAVATDARDRAIGHKTTPVVIKQGARVTKIERVVMPHAAEWEWLNTHWGGLKRAISLASVGALAPTLPWVKAPAAPWGLTPTRLRRMLRGLGVPIGVAAFAVTMGAVLRVSPRCLTRGPIGKVARRLCGMPTRWLDDVLGLLADFYVLENLCDVLPWVEAAASTVAVPFVKAVTTVTQANEGCLSKKAPTYPVPTLYLVPRSDGLLVGV